MLKLLGILSSHFIMLWFLRISEENILIFGENLGYFPLIQELKEVKITVIQKNIPLSTAN